MRLWSMAGVIAVLSAAGPVIAETSDGAADVPPSESALPPLPPPIDVPTVRTPQPPRDTDNGSAPAMPRAAPSPPRSPQPATATDMPPRPAAPSAPSRRVLAAQRPSGTVTLRPCREATYNVIIEGRPTVAYARVCQRADGSWKLTP